MKKITTYKAFWPLMALLVICLFDLIFSKDGMGFFKMSIKEGHLYGRPIDIIKNGAPLIIIAIGMTLVIAVKGIDISVGSICAISGAVAATMVVGGYTLPKTSYGVAIAAALLISMLLGAWNGFLVTKLGIQPIIATLILMVSGRGIAQLITNGEITTVSYEPYNYLGGGYIPYLKLPFSIVICLLVFLTAVIIVNRTAIGLFIKSIGINPVASKFSGVKVKLITFITYVTCGLCAGIAGLIISSQIKCADSNNAGNNIEMDAILAVAIGTNSLNGGKFSILSSVIGAVVIQTLTTTVLAFNVAPTKIPVVKAVVVIIICLIQSDVFRKKVASIFKRNGGVNVEKITSNINN